VGCLSPPVSHNQDQDEWSTAGKPPEKAFVSRKAMATTDGAEEERRAGRGVDMVDAEQTRCVQGMTSHWSNARCDPFFGLLTEVSGLAADDAPLERSCNECRAIPTTSTIALRELVLLCDFYWNFSRNACVSIECNHFQRMVLLLLGAEGRATVKLP
jgi:hypothetical protein